MAVSHGRYCMRKETRSIYIRAAKKKGRGYRPVGVVCVGCGATDIDMDQMARLHLSLDISRDAARLWKGDE